jgi:uncharacterized protein YegP (UPF0339 family)
VFELCKGSAGEFRIRLEDEGRMHLAASGKGYTIKVDRRKVIDMIKKEAAKAKGDNQAK